LDDTGDGAEEELKGIYEMLFEMANGDALIEQFSEQAFLQGKPSLQIATADDGAKVIQIMQSFKFDPFAQFQVDSRFIKNFSASVNWAHLLDEVIKEEGEQIDLLALEGVRADFKCEVDRKILEFIVADEQLREIITGAGGEEKLAYAIAAALVFGSVDVNIKSRSVMEVFNQEIRDRLEVYNEFLEDYEDKRYIPAEMLEEVTKRIAEMYQTVEGPLQGVYKNLKSLIAGPHSVQALVPTGAFTLRSKGLNVLHKFFPTEEQMADYNDGEGEEW